MSRLFSRELGFRSDTCEWGTPEGLFAELDREFGFTLDVCATPENTKCRRFYTKEDDALSRAWKGACWCNPPYGREIGLWMAMAWRESCRGATVVCLVPARTDTAWWHDYAIKGEVRFLRGRVRFVAADGRQLSCAPFPSAIVIFRPPHCGGLRPSNRKGRGGRVWTPSASRP